MAAVSLKITASLVPKVFGVAPVQLPAVVVSQLALVRAGPGEGRGIAGDGEPDAGRIRARGAAVQGEGLAGAGGEIVREGDAARGAVKVAPVIRS